MWKGQGEVQGKKECEGIIEHRMQMNSAEMSVVFVCLKELKCHWARIIDNKSLKVPR